MSFLGLTRTLFAESMTASRQLRQRKYFLKSRRKFSKLAVTRRLVRAIRIANPPGRFLRKNNDNHWVDIGDKKAAEKASQALREKGPEARKESHEMNETGNDPAFLEDFDHGSTPVAAPIAAHVAAPIAIIETHLEMIDNSDLEITSQKIEEI